MKDAEDPTVLGYAEDCINLDEPGQNVVRSEKILIAEAQVGFADEKELGPLAALKTYSNAVLWSLVFAACVIMEGYDTALLGSFYAYPAFQIRFGRFVGVTSSTPSGYQLTAAWQAGMGQAAVVGSFFGAILSGYMVPRYGQRLVVIASLVVLIFGIFFPFFAPNLPVLTIGEVICGWVNSIYDGRQAFKPVLMCSSFPWGILATCATSYASEVLPTSLRVYLTSFTNMCFIIGQLIAAGILKGLANHTSPWAYRIPFAIQWVWPCFLIPLVYLAPESPWYLVRKNRLEDAEQSLRRLQNRKAKTDTRNTLATIIHTDNFERMNNVGTRYLDCFKGPELRRTEIACMVLTGQILCGIDFAYNSSYFYENIGVGTSTTYSLNLGGTCLALCGCFVNWFALMPYIGRRTIYIWGLGGMTLALILIGILNVWTNHKQVSITQAVLTLVWTLMFQLSAGQLGWALPAEMGSTRLRQKTICVAKNANSLVGIVAGILQQYFMNPQAWNFKGYVGFVWGATCFLVFVWAFFRLPETWNRTYEELDILFAKEVSARKFASTEVNLFEDQENGLGSKQEAPTVVT